MGGRSGANPAGRAGIDKGGFCRGQLRRHYAATRKLSGPDLPATLGLEAAGTITDLGEGVSGLSVGQRVMAMGPQGNAEFVAVNANYVFPYPETVDPVQAGGMPIVFLTAYHLLKTRGQVQPGETVLIQAGASGVGTVAIQLAKAWGARVITTASSPEKLDLDTFFGRRRNHQLCCPGF